MNRARIGAVVRRELADIRRSRFVVITMTAIPLIYVSIPVFILLTQNSSATPTQLTQIAGGVLTNLMLIPLLIPVFIASSSVVGEREQGTLEPVLTTPVTREEILTGKAVAAAIPAICVAYLMMGAALAIIAVFAIPAAASAVWHAPELPVDIVFVPLLAGWSIWVCIAVSAKASDIRVATQLSALGSLPAIAFIILADVKVISSTVLLVIVLGGVLLLFDIGAYRIVSRLFDTERLVTGTKPVRAGKSRFS
jgi:ABC-type transport system involved in multi-copper enzyme maturation permease subunit